MINIQDKKKCCACSACYNICPVNAIEMVKDEKGFKYPKVNKEKCVNCGLCEKVCPILNPSAKVDNSPEAYAVKNKNEIIRKQSSSGGIFTLLAEKILRDGGVVFGATFDEEWRVKHEYVEKVEDLKKFRGSKYLQSSIGDTYSQVKKFLLEGRKVMFTGTPCQIEGLKSFLQKDYENLLTQDIICHGVPSPKVHSKYIEFVRKQINGESIDEINHRTKKNGWKDYNFYIKFNNTEYVQSHNTDLYMQAFLKNTSLRDSCYDCKFKKRNRVSDITLADFWGIESVLPEMDDDKGISLVIVNSKKGKKIFESVKDKIVYQKVDFDDAISHNPSMVYSSKPDINREKFFENLDTIPFDKLVSKYTYKPNFFRRIENKVKRICKKIFKNK